MQHVEDNVYARVVNHALFDGMINMVKDLQRLNRRTKEACLWMGEGSEERRVIPWLGRHRILALSCWKPALLCTQACVFAEHFQIVESRESRPAVWP